MNAPLSSDQWAAFNVNQYVRVKLTDTGRAALKAGHEALFHGKYAYTPPREDENGWSEWQLWDLMNQLGPYCGMGRQVPFETEIQFKKGNP